MTKQVIIMRGPSGSGKSTAARRIAEERVGPEDSCVICSADDFFMVREEESEPLVYRFDPSKLAEAHAACMRRFLVSLRAGTNLVIVDNTNVREWEYANYVLAASLAGYSVSFEEIRIETVAGIKACAARNTHGVPLMAVAQMAINWED